MTIRIEVDYEYIRGWDKTIFNVSAFSEDLEEFIEFVDYQCGDLRNETEALNDTIKCLRKSALTKFNELI